MAWRLHEHILRGEIDNRTRGRVTGRLWIAGVAAPLVLDLYGDCQPDLAGCLLTFENPAPIPLTTRPPATVQRGTSGDITAARKVRVFDVPVVDAYMMLKRGEKPPEHMANGLYLEWFSGLSGRVLIESSAYRLQISEPAWRFTAAELAERECLRAEAGGDAFFTEIRADGTEPEWDEFRHEQMLRESDATGERYRRLLEKCADHPEAERIIAHEMGWAPLDEEPDAEEADEIARMNEICEAALDAEEEPPDLAREGLDWVRDRDGGIIHPVAQQAREVLYALLNELKAGGRDLSEHDKALSDFAGCFMTLSVKLSSALSFLAHERDTDPGLIIAWLKRALEIHNETLAAAETLSGHPHFPATRLAHYRTELFHLRESILEIITRLRTR